MQTVQRPAPPRPVALLAEGVDRNKAFKEILSNGIKSPSSRRAWIEILENHQSKRHGNVALLAEGVDRNTFGMTRRTLTDRRPPRGGRG